MGSGFNTDIEAGDRLFHVQTEDRGPEAFVIDTVVYHNGRVLYRHSRNYEHFAKSSEFNPEELHERVEEQHRSVIEDLQTGVLDAEIKTAIEKAAQTAGIQVQLVTAKSWLSGGDVSLELEVVRRGDREPEPGVQVEATIEGAAKDIVHRGLTDQQGRVQLQFSLPPMSKEDLTLVIQARNQSGRDEIRFAVRAKPKAPQTGATR